MARQVKSGQKNSPESGRTADKPPSPRYSPKAKITKDKVSKPTSEDIAETTKNPLKPKKSFRVDLALFIVLLVVFFIGSGYLTFPRWKSYLASYLPDRFLISSEEQRLSGITTRIDKLEKNLEARLYKDATISALEEDRQKLGRSLTDLLERIEILEHSIIVVKKMAESATNSEEVAQARRSLKALNDRLTQIGPISGPSKRTDPELISRLEKLEEFELKSGKKITDTLHALKKSENTITSLEERLTTIEKHPEDGNPKTSLAIILAVSQLRNTVQKGHAFVDELSTVKAVAGSDPAVRATLMALEKHANTGIQTLSSLQNDFRKLATLIVEADKNIPDPGWIDLALQQISTLIKFRRIDGSGDLNSAETIVAQTEKHLAVGDLASAVTSIDRLTSDARATAEPWIASAKARQGAEQVLASLHTHALSLFSLPKG